MTPALPALDALLKEVDALEAAMDALRSHPLLSDEAPVRELDERGYAKMTPAEIEAFRVMDAAEDAKARTLVAAPRLAAMLRVAVEALGEQAKCECCDIHPTEAQDALARIERIAAGEA